MEKYYFRNDLFGLGLLILIEEKLRDLEEKESKEENPSRIVLLKKSLPSPST